MNGADEHAPLKVEKAGDWISVKVLWDGRWVQVLSAKAQQIERIILPVEIHAAVRDATISREHRPERLGTPQNQVQRAWAASCGLPVTEDGL